LSICHAPLAPASSGTPPGIQPYDDHFVRGGPPAAPAVLAVLISKVELKIQR